MVAKDIEEYIKTAVVLGRDKELIKTWSNRSQTSLWSRHIWYEIPD